MISQKELLDMIATESIEKFGVGQEISKKVPSQELPDIKYELRLIRYDDGRVEWED